MKRIAIGLVLALMGAGAFMPAAQAAGNSDDVDLRVTVNSACVLDVTQTLVDFGPQNPGTTTPATLNGTPEINFSVMANAAGVVNLTTGPVTGGTFTGGSTFKIDANEGANAGAYDIAPDGSFSIAAWRSFGTGTANYTDDAQVVLSGGQAPGTYTQHLTYTSVC